MAAKQKNNIKNNLDSLDEIIKEMEKPDTELEASFELYKKGLTIIKECSDSIDKIEQEITVLEEG